MGKSVITDALLTDIADSIRAKTGSQASMTPAEMAAAIDNMDAAPECYIDVTMDSAGTKSEQIKTADFHGFSAVPAHFFQDNTKLTNVTFDSNLTVIGAAAFTGCLNLRMSDLPSTLVYIYSSAFKGCQNVTFSVLPPGLTVITNSCFYQCSYVTFDAIPQGVTKIEQYAFYDCNRVTFSELPSGVTEISNDAFNGCSLVTFSNLPATLQKIGSTAFKDCESITSISCDGIITTLGTSLFGNNPATNNVISVLFPNMHLATLGMAFGHSTANNACQKLTTLDIGVTDIIAGNSLKYCYKLNKLVLRKANAICALSNVNAFDSTPFRGYDGGSGTVYVPQDLISTYQQATNWSTLYANGTLSFAAIEGSEFELD